MKAKILVLFMLVVGILVAQERSAVVEQSVATLTKRYLLNETQVTQVYVIQERLERNLAEIAALEATDYRLYLGKKQTLRTHTEGSIRRILNENQRAIQRQDQEAYRRMTSETIKNLQREGKSKQEIELVLLERG